MRSKKTSEPNLQKRIKKQNQYCHEIYTKNVRNEIYILAYYIKLFTNIWLFRKKSFHGMTHKTWDDYVDS